MKTINTADVVREAREMRADELRQIQGLLARRVASYFYQLASSAAAAGKALRPLFSGNPQAHRS